MCSREMLEDLEDEKWGFNPFVHWKGIVAPNPRAEC
jgi:hypothetical protein